MPWTVREFKGKDGRIFRLGRLHPNAHRASDGGGRGVRMPSRKVRAFLLWLAFVVTARVAVMAIVWFVVTQWNM